MRLLRLTKIILTLVSLSILFTGMSVLMAGFIPRFFVVAETVESPSYKIEGLTIGSDGGQDLSSNNYRLNTAIGGNLNSERLLSSSYQIGASAIDVFQANVPKVQCFEATSTATTSCSNASLIPDGAVMLCGDGGCYDKARFEIDTQNNPVDTLYSVQITTDPLSEQWDFIDGASRVIEGLSTHDINDYLTETQWEDGAGVFNIVGLDSGVTYYLRITALQGDFTESAPSPYVTETTGFPSLAFSVYAGDSVGVPSGSLIEMLGINVSSPASGNDKIWLEVGTNYDRGAIVYVRDIYEGLYSADKSYTLVSGDLDLTSNAGYGIQIASSTSDYLGPIVHPSVYTQPGDTVGGLVSDLYARELFNTSGAPLAGGVVSYEVKARANESTPIASDYTDVLLFTFYAEAK